ncbi:aryl-alcohol-oxidase from pleurotus Eryingii [Marasmius fiardii PR-910]|nr:aryl-alcohol-oxidase from pleurotus Eryingii [Marasmius fiardii PR-910]
MIAVAEVLLILLGLGALSSAAIHENLADLPNKQFDFVIIGGGTAGNVVANRLTENPNFSVLVLEAGGSNEGLLTPQVPALALSLANSPLDWNFTANLGYRTGNATTAYNRGFVLGGSSTINWMAYTRGSSDDWDRYAAVTGDPGWSWNNMQTYIRKNERITAPADGHNTTGQWDPAVHGTSGINSVSLSGYIHELDKRTIEVSKAFGPDSEFKFNLDMNAGDQLGFSWAQSTILKGSRSSSATSYLGPEYIHRPNLHILLHAHVTRILQTDPQIGGQLVFHDVELTQDNGTTFQRVTASKEIVLSAGTVGTPHILLNSGIGDSASLSKVGVKPVYNLPSVGRNLTEQPGIAPNYRVNTTDTNETNLGNATLLKQWNDTRTGPLVDPIILAFGWLRLPENDTIFQSVVDPSAGPKTGHYEYAMVNGFLGSGSPPPGQNFISPIAICVTPASRGSIFLTSSNPLVKPNIDFNFYDSEFDLVVLRTAVRSLQKFMSHEIWTRDGYLIGPTVDLQTDDEIDNYILHGTGPGLHAVGTASMSKKGAQWGVVDPDLLVKGVRGVRIVDASVLPFIPAGHTQASAYMVGERGADLIKHDWN